MIFFLALIPATMLTMAGYAVIFLANRSEGGLRNFGRYLGFWAFTLAGLLVLGSLLHAAHGGRWHCMSMHGYAGSWQGGQCPYMNPWQPPQPPPPGGGPPGAAPPK
jgi:hypothetical protein